MPIDLTCHFQNQISVRLLLGELGWRSAESTCLLPMRPELDSRTPRHMWVEFNLLLVLVLTSRGISLSSPVFPSPQKTTFPNSNSIR